MSGPGKKPNNSRATYSSDQSYAEDVLDKLSQSSRVGAVDLDFSGALEYISRSMSSGKSADEVAEELEELLCADDDDGWW